MTTLVEMSVDDGVALIALNRPEVRNAISDALRAEFVAALERVASDEGVRAVVLTGNGKSFCAGGDISGMKERLKAPAGEVAFNGWRRQGQTHKSVALLHGLPKPVIAAVNGAALAGGCGIATLCDFTLAIPEAKFGYTEVKIGFLPAIVSVFLTRQIGEKRTRDLLLTGRIIEAAEAKEMGLVNEIVPPEKLMDRAKELADILIAASPSSLTRAKRLLTSAAAASVDADLERAVLENARIRCTPDFQEGLASFLEKRKPVWRGEE